MHFLQALIAAIVTAGLGYGLSMIPVKRDRITDRPLNRQLYFTWACATFAITLIFDWAALAAGIATFTEMRGLIFPIISIFAIGAGFVTADGVQGRTGWATRIVSVMLVALLTGMLILLMFQHQHTGA